MTVANGGEEAKALGMWPADAAMPVNAPARPLRARKCDRSAAGP